jgi:hypothetical protein
MRLCLLQLDDAFDAQPDFVQTCENVGGQRIRLPKDGRDIRLWGHHAELSAFEEKLLLLLNGKAEPRLTFIGSGDFHHVSPLLLASALAQCSEPVTLIHFDNHPDWFRFEKGTHCGSWINRALKRPEVQKIITIGVCSHDLERPETKLANLPLLPQGLLELYPYDHAPSQVDNDYGAGASFEQIGDCLHWKTIRAFGEQNFIEYLLSRVQTEEVYLTIDKDVLAREDAITNWDQGCMRLPYLLSLVKAIGERHRIIGADIIGDYSKRSYSGSLRTRLSKHYEILKERPLGKPDPKKTADVNSAANHVLLAALSEAMA